MKEHKNHADRCGSLPWHLLLTWRWTCSRTCRRRNENILPSVSFTSCPQSTRCHSSSLYFCVVMARLLQCSARLFYWRQRSNNYRQQQPDLYWTWGQVYPPLLLCFRCTACYQKGCWLVHSQSTTRRQTIYSNLFAYQLYLLKLLVSVADMPGQTSLRSVGRCMLNVPIIKLRMEWKAFSVVGGSRALNRLTIEIGLVRLLESLKDFLSFLLQFPHYCLCILYHVNVA